ncbi:hypothetical protein [Pseudohalocynthiibacter sp. F2068]|jgi:hypothetical protein|uniref:hypothetical protein n=1 Tax=Pseudohalocynthiibacter sp. F2068 TaxID=2926418 RepID=UPI001FF33D31|nr:hypothetical protein [Pseudohalocynthiibacter sp. F2068]MCK0103905.1 hypothetical protein [Pseudohalocynthiibacter sp. F2068]
MKNTTPDAGPRSPYDPDPTGEEDLWFLPELDAAEQAADLPWRVADVEKSDVETWRAAEAANAVALARAAAAFGALDERLRHAAKGAQHRIGLMQVAELSWHLGDRLTEDRIALFLAARITRAGSDIAGFARAGWAHRRLLDGQGALPGELGEFLGRVPVPEVAPRDLIERPQGAEFAALEDRFWAALAEMQENHPITRAAYAWALWHRFDLSGDTARIEGAVVVSKIGAENSRGGARFLQFDGATPIGTPDVQLGKFYAGTETFCLRAMMELDRITAWQRKATAATAHLSGRTPARLIKALAIWPMLSAEALELQTGASRAAVQRNLDKLSELGLVREVTGQGRFRMWKAKG